MTRAPAPDSRLALPPPAPTAPARPGLARRALVVTLVVAGVAAVAWALVRAADVFLLFFASVLLALLLRGASDALARRTGLSPRWAFGLVVAALVLLAAGGAFAAGSVVVAQFDQFAEALPNTFAEARARLGEYTWGAELLRHAPPADELLFRGGQGAASHAGAFFTTTFGVLGNAVVLAFLTLYLAADPRPYLNGLVALVPPARRARARVVLNAVGVHLWGWLLGRLVSMAAIGVMVGVGLGLVGVPYALPLAVVAAVLTVIPYIGPILGTIPGVVVAFTQGPAAAGWALGVYLLAQGVEDYLITPLVQQQTARLPPAVAIAALTAGGALFGLAGLIVATPLAVAVMVLVQTLYVEDALGDRLDVPGETPPPAPAGG